MAPSIEKLTTDFKKRMKVGLIIAGVGVVLSLIGYFLPTNIQLIPLVVGYLFLRRSHLHSVLALAQVHERRSRSC